MTTSPLALSLLIACAPEEPNSVDHDAGAECGVNVYTEFIEGQIDEALMKQIEAVPGYKEPLVSAFIPVNTVETAYENKLKEEGIAGLGIEWNPEGEADGYVVFENKTSADFKPENGFVCEDKVVAYSFEHDIQVVGKCDFTPREGDPAHFGFCEGNIFNGCKWAADGSDLGTTAETCPLVGTFSEATVKVFGLSEDGNGYYPY